MLESEFRRLVIKKIYDKFDTIQIIYTDTVQRSFPDLFILGPNGAWAALELKASERAARQPNQGYHIQRLNEMGYGRIVYPENIEEILNDLEELFTS